MGSVVAGAESTEKETQGVEAVCAIPLAAPHVDPLCLES